LTRATMTPEEAAERKRLMQEYRIATERAAAILAEQGMESAEFAEPDRIAGQLRRQIRKIDGDAEKHWMG
jgi:hypothetical protein